MTLPAISQQLLIAKGVELSNVLHRFLSSTSNPSTDWNNKLLFLALMGYATSMAKFSELDKDDFMALAGSFYDNVVINRAEESN